MGTRGKYYPLCEYLRPQPNTGLISLNFTQVEQVLGKKLPPSARTARAWWANSDTVQGRAWQEAGWLVDDVDFEQETVVFRPAHITSRISPIRKSTGWSGEQIKSLREFAGWSQQELANRLAVRQQTISDWEMGHHAARRSVSKLLELLAQEVGFEYNPDSIPPDK